MKIIYDRETDILNLILSEGQIVESDEINEGIIIDYGKDHSIISLEILDASERIAEPSSFAYEIKDAVR